MRLNNKGISIMELLAAMLISSVVLLASAQLIYFLSTTTEDNRIDANLTNEGTVTLARLYKQYGTVMAMESTECPFNVECFILVQDSQNSLQISFEDETIMGKKIHILSTIDGVTTSEDIFFKTPVINTSLVQSCLDCPEATAKVYVLSFELYYDEDHSKEFSTSFKTF